MTYREGHLRTHPGPKNLNRINDLPHPELKRTTTLLIYCGQGYIVNQEAEVIGVRLPQFIIEDQTESDLSEVKSVKTNEHIKTIVVNTHSLVKRVVRGDSV
jgi:hypothetical protein